MGKKLYGKGIVPACAYCAKGDVASDKINVLCMKKGIRSQDDKCRKFKYDPCKRIPAKAKAMDFSKYNEDDFSL